VLLGTVLSGVAGAGPRLLTLSPRDAVLRRIDSADGSTVAGSIHITLPNPTPPPEELTVTGATGLARHPQSGTLFALLKIQGREFRELVTLDETTGVATRIGNTSHKLAGITFAADGTLYAVSGDGGVVPESLFTLSLIDGSATLLQQLGAGSDGETIAFNPDDGLLYHASGIGVQNNSQNGEIFETIDPGTLDVTNVSLSGFDYEELTALAFSGGGFFASDVGDSSGLDNPRFLRLTTGGAVTYRGDMDHVAKGLVPVAHPRPIPALPAGMLGLLVVSLLILGFRTLRTSS
jgi:hypothetical protein